MATPDETRFDLILELRMWRWRFRIADQVGVTAAELDVAPILSPAVHGNVLDRGATLVAYTVIESWLPRVPMPQLPVFVREQRRARFVVDTRCQQVVAFNELNQGTMRYELVTHTRSGDMVMRLHVGDRTAIERWPDPRHAQIKQWQAEEPGVSFEIPAPRELRPAGEFL